MKRCPVCNRSYSDEAMMFCADDGTQLVSAQPAGAESSIPPSAQPTMVVRPQFTPPPPPPAFELMPKKRKWLALIALALGIFALPFLLYSLSQPILREYAFRNLRLDRLIVGIWGVVTLFGSFLMILSVIVGAVAIVMAMRQPSRYGGKALAVIGPVLSVLLMVFVVGAFAFRRMQGPVIIDFYSDSTDNNYNSNRSDNYNSTSNSNSDYSYNSNSSDSSSAATDMSETDKYRLFYAAAKSGDTSLQQRAARKIGIVDSSGMPTSTYQNFVKGTVNWAFTDRAWVQTIDTEAKARAYALERLGPTP